MKAPIFDVFTVSSSCPCQEVITIQYKDETSELVPHVPSLSRTIVFVMSELVHCPIMKSVPASDLCIL